MIQITPRRNELGPVSRLKNGVLSLLCPHLCAICGRRVGEPGFCGDCEGEVETISGPACGRCGCPGVLCAASCPNCQEKVFRFSRLYSAWVFGESVQNLMHSFKYEGKTWLAPVMASAILTRLDGAWSGSNDTVVVPVPLHRARMRERGYNQSELLARGVANATGMQLSAALRRERMTETQTRLGLEDRDANVSGAFALREGSGLADKRVLLIDDVVTTGATVNACTDVLLAAGVCEVNVAAAASPYRVATAD